MKGKPFKETKVGKFLANNAPHVLDIVDDIFPPAKIITELLKGDDLPPEKKIELEKLLHEYEQNERRDYLSDVQNARSREIEYVKALGRPDWMQIAVGVLVMVSFCFLQYVLVYRNIPQDNKEIFLHLMGMIDTAAGLVIGYYFGSSKGSADKTKMLK